MKSGITWQPGAEVRDRGSFRRFDHESVLLLASHPNIGRARDEDLRPGLRSFPVGEYIVIYRVHDEDVVILRVLRGSRDLYAMFGQ